MNLKWTSVLPLAFALSAVAPPVGACGGCFTVTVSGAKNAQVITDHRMVLSLAGQRTTLWDQIRYAGSPEDFVWVLPIAPGREVQIGIADNAFMDALDSLSAPAIRADATTLCPGTGGSAASAPLYDYGGGCGGGGRGVDYVPGSSGSGNEMGDAGSAGNLVGRESAMLQPMGVATVGPYAATILGPSGEGGFDDWMARNGYEIPAETRAAVEHYRELAFDFLVLRLRPEAGVQQMQPVRVSFDGYVPTLPLRMIAAGVADKVGLSLMVLAPTRVRAGNFRNAEVATDNLVFDFATGRSNYRQLFDDALRRGESAWVTESSESVTAPMMSDRLPGARDAGSPRPFVDDEPHDAGVPFDAGPSDRGELAMPTGTLFVRRGRLFAASVPAADAGFAASDPYVDRRIAFEHMPNAPMLTRLRTELDRVVLDRDLTLEPSSDWYIPQRREATRYANVPPCPSASPSATTTTTTTITTMPRERSLFGCSVDTVRAPGVGMFGFSALLFGLRRWRRRDALRRRAGATLRP